MSATVCCASRLKARPRGRQTIGVHRCQGHDANGCCRAGRPFREAAACRASRRPDQPRRGRSGRDARAAASSATQDAEAAKPVPRRNAGMRLVRPHLPECFPLGVDGEVLEPTARPRHTENATDAPLDAAALDGPIVRKPRPEPALPRQTADPQKSQPAGPQKSLARVVEAWPHLRPAAQEAILAMVLRGRRRSELKFRLFRRFRFSDDLRILHGQRQPRPISLFGGQCARSRWEVIAEPSRPWDRAAFPKRRGGHRTAVAPMRPPFFFCARPVGRCGPQRRCRVETVISPAMARTAKNIRPRVVWISSRGMAAAPRDLGRDDGTHATHRAGNRRLPVAPFHPWMCVKWSRGSATFIVARPASTVARPQAPILKFILSVLP